MEVFTAIDHQYISFEIQHGPQPLSEAYKSKSRGWNPNKLHKERFIQVLRMRQGAIIEKPRRVRSKENAEKLAVEVMMLLKKADDA